MHNYDISWDYMLDDYVEEDNLLLLKRIIKNIKKEVLPILKEIKNFKVYPIILANGILGVYCNGTRDYAIIGVDIGNIISACEEYTVNIERALKTTILHELKHAWQECNNKEFDEVEAEDFAFQYS